MSDLQTTNLTDASGRQLSLFYDLGYHPSDFKSINDLPKIPCRKQYRDIMCDKDVYRKWKAHQKQKEELDSLDDSDDLSQFSDDIDYDRLDSYDIDDDSNDYFINPMIHKPQSNSNYTLTRDLTKNRIDISQTTKPQPKPDNVFFTSVIRALVVGGTGCGKTTYLLHLLKNHVRYGLDFNLIIVYAPSETLRRGLLSEFISDNNKFNKTGFNKPVLTTETGENIKVLAYDVADCYDESFLTFEDVCKLVQLNPNIKPLVIYDDCVMAMKHKVQVRKDFNNYLNQGTRCNLVALFNLLQDYSSLPPYLRNSFTVMILFPKRLARSQFKALLDNCVHSILEKNNTMFNFVMDQINSIDNMHVSLLICGEAEPNKQVRLDDCYVEPVYDTIPKAGKLKRVRAKRNLKAKDQK